MSRALYGGASGATYTFWKTKGLDPALLFETSRFGYTSGSVKNFHQQPMQGQEPAVGSRLGSVRCRVLSYLGLTLAQI